MENQKNNMSISEFPNTDNKILCSQIVKQVNKHKGESGMEVSFDEFVAPTENPKISEYKLSFKLNGKSIWSKTLSLDIEPISQENVKAFYERTCDNLYKGILVKLVIGGVMLLKNYNDNNSKNT